MGMRIVQLGQGHTRPVVLVYHLTAELDAVIKAATGPTAVIANDTRAPLQGGYGHIASLQDTLAQLQAQVGSGVKLEPVVVAGFSEGGSATQRVLTLGGDPDAIVIADGSHAPLPLVPQSIAGWRTYAERARNGERVMVASHTSLIYVESLTSPNIPYASTWHVLRDVTGFNLPLGTGPAVINRPKDVPAIVGPGPVKFKDANLIVYSYPGADQNAHVQQAKYVLGMMISEALDRLGVITCEQPQGVQTTSAVLQASCAAYPEHAMPASNDILLPNVGGAPKGISAGAALAAGAIGLGLLWLVMRKD